jgi:hypothetical protein
MDQATAELAEVAAQLRERAFANPREMYSTEIDRGSVVRVVVRGRLLRIMFNVARGPFGLASHLSVCDELEDRPVDPEAAADLTMAFFALGDSVELVPSAATKVMAQMIPDPAERRATMRTDLYVCRNPKR